MNSFDIGNLAEAKILAVLQEKYDRVLVPFGNGGQYDLVVDNDGRFLTVQIKHGRLRQGSVIFPTLCMGKEMTGYTVDLFGVYCSELDKSFLVPSCDTPYKSICSMRVDKPKNNQVSGIRWASLYEV